MVLSFFKAYSFSTFLQEDFTMGASVWIESAWQQNQVSGSLGLEEHCVSFGNSWSSIVTSKLFVKSVDISVPHVDWLPN